MDIKKEYHDPDYPETSKTPEDHPKDDIEAKKIEKIQSIIRREFTNEIDVRENEIMGIDERMSSARRILHRLRYALVNSYYTDQKLQLNNSQIEDEISAQSEPRARAQISSILREGQKRIHPSVRKLLGTRTVDLDEILRSKGTRNKTRKNYSTMLTRNYKTAADKTKSQPTDVPESTQPKVEVDPSTSRPKKIPRHIEPKVGSVVKLDEVTRNKMKHRYRIIIGNTSKYAPAASRVDKSTHKWLLYVRGVSDTDLTPIVRSVTVRLHHSYAPHHTVHIHKPPFHLSRRGWGEFPAKVELHFALPDRNRPATIEHTIKLDRNYTGLQTLGAETIVDVWLYSTPEMQQHEYKDENTQIQTDVQTDIPIKEEPKHEDTFENEIQNETNESESWMDFFTTPCKELDVDEMIIIPERVAVEIETTGSINETDIEVTQIKTEPLWSTCGYDDIEMPSETLPSEILTQSPMKRIMKYIDPSTGKIYYLEMDRKLDLSKVQEIEVVNASGQVETAKISPIKSNGLKNFRKQKKGVSLLKPEVKNILSETKEQQKCDKSKNFAHIQNDHCYLGGVWAKDVNFLKSELPSERNIEENVVSVKNECVLYECLCNNVRRMNSIRAAVNYLLKKIPVISEMVRDPDFEQNFPFVVENDEKYWKLDFVKRRNIEWSRAHLIKNILKDNLKTSETIWQTKQIIIFSRLHGFYPIRADAVCQTEESMEWSQWNELENKDSIRELYGNSSDITSLTIFNSENFLNASYSEIDLCQSDEEIDIVGELPVVKKEVSPEKSKSLTMLPVENEDDSLRFLFLERKCADLGIELRNEDVGSGCSYSAVHAVMLSAMKSFAEELIRGALAEKLAENPKDELPSSSWIGSSSSVTTVRASHVYRAVQNNARTQLCTARGLGARAHRTCAI